MRATKTTRSSQVSQLSLHTSSRRKVVSTITRDINHIRQPPVAAAAGALVPSCVCSGRHYRAARLSNSLAETRLRLPWSVARAGPLLPPTSSWSFPLPRQQSPLGQQVRRRHTLLSPLLRDLFTWPACGWLAWTFGGTESMLLLLSSLLLPFAFKRLPLGLVFGSVIVRSA
jgi:hypothetical protein